MPTSAEKYATTLVSTPWAVPEAGDTAWTNPGNAQGDDDAYATCVATPPTYPPNWRSERLRGTGLGFAIPSTAAITGIKVSIVRKASHYTGSTSGPGVYGGQIQLLKAGSPVGATSSVSQWWATTEATVNLGGASSLWSTTWTPADINASGFGFDFAAGLYGDGGASVTAYVDSILVTVYYTGYPNVVSGVPASGIASRSGIPIAKIGSISGV